MPLFIWLGFRFGGQIDQLLQIILRVKLLALAVIAVAVGVSLVIRARRRRGGKAPTRAPVDSAVN